MLEQHAQLTKQVAAEHPWGVSEYKLVQNFCFVDDKWVTREYEESGDVYYGEEVEPFRTKEEAEAHVRAKILRALEANDPCVESSAIFYGVPIPKEYLDFKYEKRRAQLVRELERLNNAMEKRW